MNFFLLFFFQKLEKASDGLSHRVTESLSHCSTNFKTGEAELA